jgi:hypothetical protein
MKPTAKFFKYDDKIWFDIVDMDDTITVGDNVLPELLFTSDKGYKREGSADRAADKAIEKFNRASESDRRRMCGYDPVSKCGVGKDRTARQKLRKRPGRS